MLPFSKRRRKKRGKSLSKLFSLHMRKEENKNYSLNSTDAFIREGCTHKPITTMITE
jgi:hypothetical protein